MPEKIVRSCSHAAGVIVYGYICVVSRTFNSTIISIYSTGISHFAFKVKLTITRSFMLMFYTYLCKCMAVTCLNSNPSQY